MSKAAVFIDRDGVLVEDCDFLTCATQLRLLSSVPAALSAFKQSGLQLIVITNQAVVARGMISELQLEGIHAAMAELLANAGAPRLDAIYACPHHPQATVSEYRVECDCRKPRPGSLLRAAREHDIDLAVSWMVGDRMTDIIAGARAGCRTVLVQSPKTSAQSIVTLDPVDGSIKPDFVCSDLKSAADWILSGS